MCARAATALLAHVNLLLAVFAGAMLATGARLKWDPSTYVVLREVAPAEYRVTAALIPAVGLLLLLLAHTALGALAMSAHSIARRLLLGLYAVCMAGLAVAEVVLGSWVAMRVQRYLQSAEARQVQHDLADIRDHLGPLLSALAHWNPLPKKISQIIEEAEADAPRNGYVAGAAFMLLLVLQVTAVVLSVLTCRGTHAHSERSIEAERTRLVTAR